PRQGVRNALPILVVIKVCELRVVGLQAGAFTQHTRDRRLNHGQQITFVESVSGQERQGYHPWTWGPTPERAPYHLANKLPWARWTIDSHTWTKRHFLVCGRLATGLSCNSRGYTTGRRIWTGCVAFTETSAMACWGDESNGRRCLSHAIDGFSPADPKTSTSLKPPARERIWGLGCMSARAYRWIRNTDPPFIPPRFPFTPPRPPSPPSLPL